MSETNRWPITTDEWRLRGCGAKPDAVTCVHCEKSFYQKQKTNKMKIFIKK